jgi:hypothetical protein
VVEAHQIGANFVVLLLLMLVLLVLVMLLVLVVLLPVLVLPPLLLVQALRYCCLRFGIAVIVGARRGAILVLSFGGCVIAEGHRMWTLGEGKGMAVYRQRRWSQNTVSAMPVCVNGFTELQHGVKWIWAAARERERERVAVNRRVAATNNAANHPMQNSEI